LNIATADLFRLAERDETVRRAVALYLAEKVKNGTPRQREIAEKIPKRHPPFPFQFLLFLRNRRRCAFRVGMMDLAVT
jgi:hypothetical protein